MLSETVGAFEENLEQPPTVPIASRVRERTSNLAFFIFVLCTAPSSSPGESRSRGPRCRQLRLTHLHRAALCRIARLVRDGPYRVLGGSLCSSALVSRVPQVRIQAKVNSDQL